MESKLVLETVHNVHLQVSKVEITMRRKNAPLAKAQIKRSTRWFKVSNRWANEKGVECCCIYGDHNAIWNEKLKLDKKKIPINKYTLTRVCACCGNKKAYTLKRGGCLFSTFHFIQQEDEDTKTKYAYVFCSEQCRDLFAINPLAYEKSKEEDASVHV